MDNGYDIYWLYVQFDNICRISLLFILLNRNFVSLKRDKRGERKQNLVEPWMPKKLTSSEK